MWRVARGGGRVGREAESMAMARAGRGSVTRPAKGGTAPREEG